MKLGIDPARGWAAMDGTKVIDCGTVAGVPEICQEIRQRVKMYPLKEVIIEKPADRKVYPRPGQNHRAMLKIAANVGENRQKAYSIYYFCQGLGLPVRFKSPARGMTKLDRRAIEALTGYKGRSSEHARDAIAICL